MLQEIPAHELSYLTEEHLDQVFELDARSCTYFDEDLDIDTVHPHAWTKTALTKFLKQRVPPTHGYVLTLDEHPGELAGYMAYEMWPTEIRLLAFVVDPQYRRQGLGVAMLMKLHRLILQSPERKTIAIYIREKDNDSIGFFKKLRFRSKLARAHFEDGSDAIRFWFTEVKTAEDELEK